MVIRILKVQIAIAKLTKTLYQQFPTLLLKIKSQI